MIKMHGGRRAVPLTIAADQATPYNIFTAALSPPDVVDVTVTVNAGVACKSGMVTGSGWAQGSTITIVNNGTIAGLAGGTFSGDNGFGDGGKATWSVPSAQLTAGTDGRNGTDALTLSINVTIDNTSGLIAGGGGEGGGGGSGASTDPPSNANDIGAGGGGGAGQGYIDISGQTPPHGGFKGAQDGGIFNVAPQDGGAGSSAAAGVGGNGGQGGPSGAAGGKGGDGGSWGQPGSSGNGASGSATKAAGAGGAAGKAVALNGFTVTWQGGNDATHVKGAVS